MISGQCFSRPDVERRCLSCILSTFAEQEFVDKTGDGLFVSMSGPPAILCAGGSGYKRWMDAF